MKNPLQATISLSLILGSITMAAIANPATELEANHWQLVHYLNGSAGCNSYFGNYSADGEKLTIVHPMGTTMKFCTPPVMEQEHVYLELLSQVSGYHIDDETLVLLNQAQQPVLKYAVQQPAELEETQWQATGINNGRGGVVSSATTELSTAQFLDGKLTGNAGCNQYSAGFTVEENKIVIGPVMTTRKHCPEPAGIMQQEQEYLQAITGTRILTLDTRKLELRNEEGALQVRFSVKVDMEGAGEKEQQPRIGKTTDPGQGLHYNEE